MGKNRFLVRRPVAELVEARGGLIRISEHGYDKLAEDELTAREVLGCIPDAMIVEECPSYPKGACFLLL